MLSTLAMSRRGLLASHSALRCKTIAQGPAALSLASVHVFPPSLHLQRLQGLPQLRCFAQSGENAGGSDSNGKSSNRYMRWGVGLVAFAAANVLLQRSLGTGENTFDKRFIVYNKDPSKLEEFYSAEDLLHVMGIHPFFFELIMGRVMWWDPADCTPEKNILPGTEDGHITVKNIGMEIAFELSEEECEDEFGETTVASFERFERFINYIPFLADKGFKTMLCDHTWKFGFNRRKDGSVECYHKCEKFWGLWPMRLGMWAHMVYTTWACESFLNKEEFGDDDRMDETNDELAFLLPHIYMDLIDKLLHVQHKNLAQKVQEKPAEQRTNEENAAIEEHEKQIEQLQNLKKDAESGEQSPVSVVRRTATFIMPAAPSGVRRTATFVMPGGGIDSLNRDGWTPGQGFGAVESPPADDEAPKVKLMTGSKGTQEVLQKALMDATQDVEVHAAIAKLANHPEMEWKSSPSFLSPQKSFLSPQQKSAPN